jgi:hypothetical protein
MKFRDEDGNVVELEAVARVYVEEQEYLVLAPLDENSEDEFVFRVDRDSEGKEELNAVEDDEEFLKVKKEYKNLIYGEVE